LICLRRFAYVVAFVLLFDGQVLNAFSRGTGSMVDYGGLLSSCYREWRLACGWVAGLSAVGRLRLAAWWVLAGLWVGGVYLLIHRG
jgi:hypothetical protein